MVNHSSRGVPVLVLVLACAFTTGAAADVFLHVTGAQQGDIRGDVTVYGFEDWIEVASFTHGVTVPLGHDGRPSGAPVPSPFQLVKPYDRSTVPLFDALYRGERLDEVRLELTRAVGAGQIETYYRITLENAFLSGIEESGTGLALDLPLEACTLTYAQITLEDLANGLVTTYTWNPAVTVPAGFAGKSILLAPSPNPMAGSTEFRFMLPVASQANLTVYDVRGRRIRELHKGVVHAAPTVVAWNGCDEGGARVAQGMYIARLETPSAVVTQRVVVVR